MTSLQDDVYLHVLARDSSNELVEFTMNLYVKNTTSNIGYSLENSDEKGSALTIEYQVEQFNLFGKGIGFVFIYLKF